MGEGTCKEQVQEARPDEMMAWAGVITNKNVFLNRLHILHSLQQLSLSLQRSFVPTVDHFGLFITICREGYLGEKP